MDSNQAIIRDLKNYLLSVIGDKIKDVILFGSRAYSRSSGGSDYDILIILNSKYDWKEECEIIDLCYDIDLKYDIIIDPHIISIFELNELRGRQPIFSKAIKSGIYA